MEIILVCFQVVVIKMVNKNKQRKKGLIWLIGYSLPCWQKQDAGKVVLLQQAGPSYINGQSKSTLQTHLPSCQMNSILQLRFPYPKGVKLTTKIYYRYVFLCSEHRWNYNLRYHVRDGAFRLCCRPLRESILLLAKIVNSELYFLHWVKMRHPDFPLTPHLRVTADHLPIISLVHYLSGKLVHLKAC